MILVWSIRIRFINLPAGLLNAPLFYPVYQSSDGVIKCHEDIESKRKQQNKSTKNISEVSNVFLGLHSC